MLHPHKKNYCKNDVNMALLLFLLNPNFFNYKVRVLNIFFQSRQNRLIQYIIFLTSIYIYTFLKKKKEKKLYTHFFLQVRYCCKQPDLNVELEPPLASLNFTLHMPNCTMKEPASNEPSFCAYDAPICLTFLSSSVYNYDQ